jgi:predicted tellurium resistance membrane protein TerC
VKVISLVAREFAIKSLDKSIQKALYRIGILFAYPIRFRFTLLADHLVSILGTPTVSGKGRDWKKTNSKTNRFSHKDPT